VCSTIGWREAVISRATVYGIADMVAWDWLSLALYIFGGRGLRTTPTSPSVKPRSEMKAHLHTA
jgi:hypothetical protein